MKTGSFVLNKDALNKVSGGVSPNDLWYPLPNPSMNIPPATLLGGGGSNLHSAPFYQYQIGINVGVSENLYIGASAQGSSNSPVAIGGIGVGFTFP